MRVQNTKRTVTRSGKGKVTVKFKSAKQLRKSQKLVVEITSGKATGKFTVRPNKKAVKGALAVPVRR